MQQDTNPQPVSWSLKELAEILVKAQGYRDGFYEASFEFQIAVGAVGPGPEQTVPGAILGLHRVGIVKIDKMNHNSVDASQINKPKKPRTKTTA